MMIRLLGVLVLAGLSTGAIPQRKAVKARVACLAKSEATGKMRIVRVGSTVATIEIPLTGPDSPYDDRIELICRGF